MKKTRVNNFFLREIRLAIKNARQKTPMISPQYRAGRPLLSEDV